MNLVGLRYAQYRWGYHSGPCLSYRWNLSIPSGQQMLSGRVKITGMWFSNPYSPFFPQIPRKWPYGSVLCGRSTGIHQFAFDISASLEGTPLFSLHHDDGRDPQHTFQVQLQSVFLFPGGEKQMLSLHGGWIVSDRPLFTGGIWSAGHHPNLS